MDKNSIPPEIDLHNIRTKEQLKATLAWWEAGKKSGCMSWCNNREGQLSPIVFETIFFEVRQEHESFKKPGVDRWFIILKRHASLDEMTLEEGAEKLWVEQRVRRTYNIKGCFITRTGPKENTASSLSDSHFYEIAVKTTPGIPYAETLVKNLTGANLERLDKRAEEISKD